MRRIVTRLVIATSLLGCSGLAVPARAVTPAHWIHTAEADFESGKTDQTVVTNLGDVKLAKKTAVLAELQDRTSVIYDMVATADGDVYLAGGPEGKLLRRHGDKVDELATFTGQQAFCLDLLDGKPLLALSGEKSTLAVWEGDKLRTLVELEDVRYVWDMVVNERTVYLATGTKGALLRVTLPAAGDEKPAQVEWLLRTAQANLLCLARDGQGRLFLGTDTDGLVYRVALAAKSGAPWPVKAAEGVAKPEEKKPATPEKKPAGKGKDKDKDAANVGPAPGVEAFVLYDAPEPEIGALWVRADGTVFAGTADAEQAKPGRLAEAATLEAGRPGAPAVPAKPPEVKDLPQVPPPAAPIGGEGDKRPTEPAPAPTEKEGNVGDEHEGSGAKSAEGVAHIQAVVTESQLIDLEAGTPPATTDSPSAPTRAQRDELRAVIRKRLEEARQTGTLQTRPGMTRRPITARPAGPAGPAGAPRPGSKQGNAIYRITPDGFVAEVFRESVMVLSLQDTPAGLLVATGNQGQIYRINVDAEETVILIDLESQQIPALLLGPDGQILAATANPASLLRLEPGFADEGSYTSTVLDASQISLWGTAHLTATIPANTSVGFQTRSGNVDDPDKGGWSDWSAPQSLTQDAAALPLSPRRLSNSSPPARFLQYRLTLKPGGEATPVVDRIDLSYIVPNLKPQVTSLRATYTGEGQPPRPGPRPTAAGPSAGAANANAGNADPEPQTMLNIDWEATDPNNDTLRYQVEYQFAGTDRWLTLQKSLDQSRHEWQTRQMPDGRYLLRVTATDAPSNPPDMALTATRQSDPILIDNTPPRFEQLVQKPAGGKLAVSGKVIDGLSTIQRIEYRTGDDEPWQTVLPTDLIMDSTEESFSVNIAGLAPGQHVITWRAVDVRNNPRYEAMLVTME